MYGHEFESLETDTFDNVFYQCAQWKFSSNSFPLVIENCTHFQENWPRWLKGSPDDEVLGSGKTPAEYVHSELSPNWPPDHFRDDSRSYLLRLIIHEMTSFLGDQLQVRKDNPAVVFQWQQAANCQVLCVLNIFPPSFNYHLNFLIR